MYAINKEEAEGSKTGAEEDGRPSEKGREQERPSIHDSNHEGNRQREKKVGEREKCTAVILNASGSSGTCQPALISLTFHRNNRSSVRPSSITPFTAFAAHILYVLWFDD